MENKVYSKIESSIGEIFIVADDSVLSAIYMGEEDFQEGENSAGLRLDNKNQIIQECISQLKEYFAGKRTEFNLPIEPKGTSFQMAVWKELCDIPLGQTRSYQDIANQIGNSKAVRAIGQANKANRLPIVIPCHRVIGKNKSLTGYAGSRTAIKKVLLDLEGAQYK